MGKINIRVVLKNDDILTEEEYVAIKKDNKITYQENDYKVSLIIGETIKLIRENNDTIINMEFNKDSHTKGSCMLKNSNAVIDLDIETSYLMVNEDIIIKYKVLTTNQEVTYKLEVLK